MDFRKMGFDTVILQRNKRINGPMLRRALLKQQEKWSIGITVSLWERSD